MARTPAKPKARESERPDGPSRVILLTGLEAERKQAEALEYLKQADPDFADFDAETLDGSHASAEQVLGAVGTVPFGNGKKVVLLRDTQQLDTEEQKRLAAGLDRIPPQGLLVLHTGSPIIEDGKTKRGSAVSTELANAVKKLGEVRDFALPKVEDLRGHLIQEARRLGKTLDSEALALLSQLPADDVRHIGTELEKAALHAGTNAKITAADVEATLSRGPDDVIFKLCDAVGMRKPKEALQHVNTLFRGSSRPDSVAPRTLVLLARQIRLVMQFRFLGEKKMAGRNAQPVSPQVAALLPADGAASILANPRTAWMADKYIGQARNFTLPELEERLEKLLNADLALKGSLPGGDNPQAVLQRLVIELC
ncbi:DNA polymerase III subunit delta [Armatimonas rosea]|uniref:DNA polymerase III subunit delta n=1 Tax=Armatimonas rosea TaxID=685828 RepID=A0A7W9SUS0_ARMRO|nr:DNA polymerase III subunit delta [Armatimonas rosea]MBB6052423.1 DNA polymerase III delta subunit [Armatimonas rosea]